jgi:DNA-nicking Smr family endonuclease
MARPRVTDDGRTVVLDLHGATVQEGERMVRRIAELAGRRGRATLRVVHGSSTSDPLFRAPTLRQAVHDLLDDGELRPWVVSDFRLEDAAILSLGSSGALGQKGGESTRLSTSDLYATHL